MRILRPEEIVDFPKIRQLTPDELKQACALVRESFTAADLAEFTQEWDGVPMEQLLAEMEAQQRRLESQP